jgi:hypothetical protein
LDFFFAASSSIHAGFDAPGAAAGGGVTAA